MTTYSESTVTCGACGHNFQHHFLVSTNRFGSIDLDTRPAEMERSTMIAWIQQCPNCGYCAADASQFEHGLRKALESSDYQQHLTDTALPRLAPRFICSALLLEAAGKMHEAGREFLRVAWVMDDAELVVGSKTWRDRAAKCLTGAMESSEAERRAEIGAVLVDCLRRAGRGQEALPVIDRILSGESSAVIEQVLVFQRELITHGDIRVHKISEAIKKEN